MVPIVLLPKDKKPEEMDAEALKGEGTVYHLITSEGIFLRHVNQLYSTTQKVDKLDFLGKAEAGALVYFKPIPHKLLDEMTAFCAEIYRQYDAEAIVILYYNPATREWRFDVPNQDTSRGGLSVDYKEPPPAPEGFSMLGSLHSHANATAFQSGTDHADEATFDGVHITVGNLGSANPSYHVRLHLAGKAWTVADESILIEPAAKFTATFPPELLARVKPKSSGVIYTGTGGNWKPKVDPDEWFDKIIPHPETDQPTDSYKVGLYRSGADGRVSPLNAEAKESDWMGELCWWAGEVFVKVGKAKGQWALISKDKRDAIWGEWQDLKDWQQEDLAEHYDATLADQCAIRLALATSGNPKKTLAKRLRKINRGATKTSDGKRIMTTEEWDEYLKREYPEQELTPSPQGRGGSADDWEKWGGD